MEDTFAVFDVAGIRQSCFQTCESDPFKFPITLGSLPAYRDPDTRDSFVRLGTFFGCVDLCEKEYELKRVLYPLPAVALALLLVLTIVLCACHRSCPLHKWRKRREKNSKALGVGSSVSISSSTSSSSSTFNVSSTSSPGLEKTKRNSINGRRKVAPEDGVGSRPSSATAIYRPELDTTLWPSSIALPSNSSNVQRRSRNGKGLEESSRDLASKFSHNLNDSGKSNASRNSWVSGSESSSKNGSKKSSGRSNGRDDEGNNRNRKKESSAERRHRLRAREFMATATMLGKRLAALEGGDDKSHRGHGDRERDHDRRRTRKGGETDGHTRKNKTRY